jgi:hypothetical protein
MLLSMGGSEETSDSNTMTTSKETTEHASLQGEGILFTTSPSIVHYNVSKKTTEHAPLQGEGILVTTRIVVKLKVSNRYRAM